MGICDAVDPNSGDGGCGFFMGEVERIWVLSIFIEKIRLGGYWDFFFFFYEMR